LSRLDRTSNRKISENTCGLFRIQQEQRKC
jgi:hypothetical protein